MRACSARQAGPHVRADVSDGLASSSPRKALAGPFLKEQDSLSEKVLCPMRQVRRLYPQPRAVSQTHSHGDTCPSQGGTGRLTHRVRQRLWLDSGIQPPGPSNMEHI